MRRNRLLLIEGALGLLGLLAFLLWGGILGQHQDVLPQVHERQGGGQTEPSTKTKPYVYSWPKCEGNTSVAQLESFKTYPKRIQDFLSYQHCRHFPMLLDLPDKCGGADSSAEVFLLLVMKSTPDSFDRREVIRKTWAQERLKNGVRIKRVFILGTIHTGLEKKRLNSLLQMEQRQYNDILQWDFEESFINLTLKQVLFLQWMERNCPKARFLLDADDDVFAHTDNMIEYLQSIKDNDGSKHLFVGQLNKGMPVIREPHSKYFVPVEVQESNYFLPYCSGGGFLLSGRTALIIYNMSQSVPIHPIDDAYMGMCLAKAGLSPANHVGFKPFGLQLSSSKVDEYDPCFYEDLLLVHRFLSANMYFMWQKISEANLKCSGPKKK